MNQLFKAIYFPPDRTLSGKPARVTISLPALASNEVAVRMIRRLSSRELRQVLGDPVLEDLRNRARIEGRSLSNLCLQLLRQSLESQQFSVKGPKQSKLPVEFTHTYVADTVGVTFKDSKKRPIHRWYPYVEGFSADYIRGILVSRDSRTQAVYDPFGGCGTLPLEASLLGITSFYSEINPFAAFVCDTKVNEAPRAAAQLEKTEAIIKRYVDALEGDRFASRARQTPIDSYNQAFPKRDYFETFDVQQLLAAVNLTEDICQSENPAYSLVRLAIASIAVSASRMTRRADLRRRRADEYKHRVVDVRRLLVDKLADVREDVHGLTLPAAPAHFISADSRHVSGQFDQAFDLAVTSPPYLNGTNYFRNTKIELWLLGFISSEKQLHQFTSRAIACGINNVSKRRDFRKFPAVEEIAERLDEVAYDARIPSLIRCYFSDMEQVFEEVWKVLKPGAEFVLDIGDSKFAGVYVPTDVLLLSSAQAVGFEIVRTRLLARRYSHDKTVLAQKELILRKPNGTKRSHIGT